MLDQPAKAQSPGKIGTGETTRRRTQLPEAISSVFCQAYGCSTLDDAIIAACADLRYRAGEITPPFSLMKLLAACEARLIRSPMATDGRLEWRTDGFTVTANSQFNWRRQRFR